MSIPTLGEVAAHIGTAPTDPKLARALAEAVEILTQRLGQAYTSAGTSRPATMWRAHADLTKAIYEHGRTQAGPAGAPVRGSRAAEPSSVLASIAAELETLDTALNPDVG